MNGDDGTVAEEKDEKVFEQHVDALARLELLNRGNGLRGRLRWLRGALDGA